MSTGAITEGSVRRNERLEALYHMAVELSALRSLDSVLNTALQHCLDLTDSQFGFVGLTTDDGQAMDVVANCRKRRRRWHARRHS